MTRSGSLGIVGTGLIGGSIGLAARAAGRHVTGWDANESHARLALERGALDAVASNLEELAAEADILVVALPLEATVATIERFGRIPPPARLIVDVASVKTTVARAGVNLAAFVPTHPIAGSHESGPAASHAGLFAGAVWTYDPAARSEAVSLAQDFIVSLGARPLAVTSEEHDRVIALTSHLPQVVAVALASLLSARIEDDTVAALCGPGMRSMTRLGASAWSMWREVLGTNGPLVAQEVRELLAILSDAAGALETGAVERLEAQFAEAASAVARLETNAGTDARVDREHPVSVERSE